MFVCFVVLRPLTVVASPVAEHRLRTRRLSSHGSRAQLLRGMWDLPGPGHEPVSPASAGGLSTTAPPGRPFFAILTPRMFSTLFSRSLAINLIHRFICFVLRFSYCFLNFGLILFCESVKHLHNFKLKSAKFYSLHPIYGGILHSYLQLESVPFKGYIA